METISKYNLTEIIVKLFPEFSRKYPPKESFDYYDYFRDFSATLCEKIDRGEKNEEFIDKAFELLNKMAEEGTSEIQNDLVVTPFEMFDDEGTRTKVAREKLKGRALEYFERVLRGWDKG